MNQGYQPLNREQAEFERDRRKWRIRRRFAISSFIQLICMTLFYLIAPYHMTIEQAKVFAEFNSIVITLIGFHTGIVMVYMGAVTYSEQIKDGILTKDISTGS